MIKAIVFDFGNVISEPQDTGCYARMASLSGLSEASFMEAFRKYRPSFDRGDINGRELYRDVLAAAGVRGNEAGLDALADALLEEDLRSWSRVSRAVTEWGLSLQKSGYKLGVLSNMPHEYLKRYGGTVELFGKADVAVFSCDVNAIKPDMAIYRVLIERAACEAGEIVFFDDVDSNVEGARKAGIRAFLWTGIERAKKDWADTVASSRLLKHLPGLP